MNNDLEYKELSSKSKEEIMELFKTNEDGLNKNVYHHRLEEYGENIATNKKKKTPMFFILEALKDKFVLILFLLAAIDFITDDKIGAFIILGITLISVIIRFSQDWSTYKFNEKLKEKINVETGIFGAEMKVDFINDGPITIMLEKEAQNV